MLSFLSFPRLCSQQRSLPDKTPTAVLAACRAALQGVVLGEDCAQAKPHPDPYLEGLRLLGLQPEDASGCLVVEDSPSGIRAGVAAGKHLFHAGHAVGLLLAVDALSGGSTLTWILWCVSR